MSSYLESLYIKCKNIFPCLLSLCWELFRSDLDLVQGKHFGKRNAQWQESSRDDTVVIVLSPQAPSSSIPSSPCLQIKTAGVTAVWITVLPGGSGSGRHLQIMVLGCQPVNHKRPDHRYHLHHASSWIHFPSCHSKSSWSQWIQVRGGMNWAATEEVATARSFPNSEKADNEPLCQK
jgi:hypothetical protein